MSEFHRTSMCRKYYESDLPKLTKVLEKIADQLEKSNKLEEKRFILEERINKLTIKESKIDKPNNLLGLR